MKARTTLSLPSKSLTSSQVTGLDMLDLNKLDGEIWTFMSDYKKRTVHEIRHAIVLLGYPLPIVDRRLDAIFAKKWFDRNGERGNDVKYTLKKHIKNPNKEKAVEQKDSEVQATTVAPRSVGTMLKGSIVATLASKAGASESVSQEPASSMFVTPVTPAPLGKVVETPADKPHAMLSGAPVAATATENVVSYVVNPEDPVRVAIWKTMHDGQQYTLADLATLLEHITESALKYNLQAMTEDGLFFTERKNKKSPVVYRMLSDVPMPEGFPPYNPRPKAEAKPEDKPTDEKPLEPVAPAAQSDEQQHTNQESLMSTNSNPAASLFSMTAQIRGQDFTLQQLREIKSDLTIAGFIPNDHYGEFPGFMTKNIGFKVTIRDMEFTMEEIKELAKQLATI